MTQMNFDEQLSLVARSPYPTMAFIGVSTGSSSVQRLFPAWARDIGLEAKLVGIDLPLESKPELYETVVRVLKESPTVVGSLVTSHKTGVFEHAGGEFDTILDTGILLREISVIYKLNGALIGDATDPVALGQLVPRVCHGDTWKNGEEDAVILGAGGAGLALAYCLSSPEIGRVLPRRITITDTRIERLDIAASILTKVSDLCDYRLVGEGGNEQIVANAQNGSLIVNATGLGKDRPGSPINSSAIFPKDAIVWEFNYRGQLEFLKLAHLQKEDRNLSIHNGWSYFIYGWTAVLSRVFSFEFSEAVVSRFQQTAEKIAGERQLS